VFFLLGIVFSVLKFTDSHYPVVIFKLLFSICILDKPVLVPTKTLLQLKTEILKPVSVSLTVKTFEKPVVLWMKSSGGKLSTWLVRETHNEGKRLYNTYLLISTVTPLKHTDFGSYSVRIRNSEL
jgi:hypothetical protein